MQNDRFKKLRKASEKSDHYWQEIEQEPSDRAFIVFMESNNLVGTDPLMDAHYNQAKNNLRV